MKAALFLSLALLCAVVSAAPALSQKNSKAVDASDKPRVFITDSQSWEIAGYSGGANGAGGSTTHGGARPQTAEIIKTFGERCHQVVTNNLQQKADYIVLLDHEGGKSFVRHKNKVAVFARASGDSVMSKSTVSLGGSVQEACEAITKDWTDHGPAIREAALAAVEQSKPAPPPPAPVATPVPVPVAAPAPPPPAHGSRLTVTSTPEGADIEVDGEFAGNTPSDVQVPEGTHTITVKKTGFGEWRRKLKVNDGSALHLNADLEKLVASPQ